MAVYNQNPETYEHTYYVGQSLGKLEIIQIDKVNITAVCECGNVLSRGIAAFQARPPFSCKPCAKAVHADSAIIQNNNTALHIRDYDAIEALMMKEASHKKLTSHEKNILCEYREKIANTKIKKKAS